MIMGDISFSVELLSLNYLHHSNIPNSKLIKDKVTSFNLPRFNICLN